MTTQQTTELLRFTGVRVQVTTMLRFEDVLTHDIQAGLFVPVELYVVEQDGNAGTIEALVLKVTAGET
jgi:hypothetical protein